MLSINSIKNGIVIDHINAGSGFSIFKYLKLNEVDYPVALIINAKSKKYGSKDMIKIENTLNLDYGVLGFIDPQITINLIENETIKEKVDLRLPSEIEDIIKCKNPRCITTQERNPKNKFELIDEDTGKYKCKYCDQVYSWDE